MADNNGFTLLELMVSMLIGAVVFGAAFLLFIYNSNLYAGANNAVNIQSDNTQIMETLTILARNSADIDDSDGASGIYYFLDETGADFAKVEFNSIEKTLTIDGSPTVYKKIGNFKMEPDNPPSRSLWNIEITGDRKKASQTVKTTVKLRNYDG